MDDITTIILAAGKGTRMKSEKPKVLFNLLGKPLINYPVSTARTLKIKEIIVVVGYGKEEVMGVKGLNNVKFAVQNKQLGTADAVKAGIREIKKFKGDVLILSGDVPMLKAITLKNFIKRHRLINATVSVLTAIADNPLGYGRIVRNKSNEIEKIVEEKDAALEEKRIMEINSGIYLVKSGYLKKALKKIKNDNAQKEYYLTDIVVLAKREGEKVMPYKAKDFKEISGINSRKELAGLEKIKRREIAEKLMDSGVSIIDPETVYIDEAVKIGIDTVIYPNVYIYGSTKIGKNCTIEPGCKIENSIIGNNVRLKAYSVITESNISNDASVGPFAHLRPASVMKKGAKAGNFVEMKKSVLGKNSKASHLTYIGDSTIGSDVNIGAGTITCNYDGIKKHKTVIKDGVFIGSNTEIVAPVTIGRGAITGAGTTVTKDVPENALALSRVKQVNIEGYALRRKSK